MRRFATVLAAVGAVVWAAMFDEASAADQQAGDPILILRAWLPSCARRLLDDPREVRVLHGDIHHYIIRQSARRLARLRPEERVVQANAPMIAPTPLCNLTRVCGYVTGPQIETLVASRNS